MKKELQIFNNKEFGDIRIIEENGKSIRSKDCRVRRICMGFERYVILNSTKTYKGHRLNGVLLLSIINLCSVTP